MEKQKLSVKNSITDYIEWLAQYGASADGGVTRLLYTKEWMDAQLAVKTEMSSFGLETRFDDVGNVFGRLSGTQSPDEVILTGSHIDTVINGGKYDGAYGVLAAMLAIKQLKETYGAPKKTLEAVSLCEEEGSRFPMTYWGSGNMTGVFSVQDAGEPRDESGVSCKLRCMRTVLAKACFSQRIGQISALLLSFILNRGRHWKCQAGISALSQVLRGRGDISSRWRGNAITREPPP